MEQILWSLPGSQTTDLLSGQSSLMLIVAQADTHTLTHVPLGPLQLLPLSPAHTNTGK